jgi:hypothetical protein
VCIFFNHCSVCFLKVAGAALFRFWIKTEEKTVVSSTSVQGFKGIVSRVWEQLQWNPNDRSEEFRTAGAYFYSLLMPFSCFNSKKKHSVAVSHLTVILQMMSNSRISLCEWWVTAADQHHWSLLTYEWIKQLGGTVTIAEIYPASNITLEFFIWGVSYHLKNERTGTVQHRLKIMICGC